MHKTPSKQDASLAYVANPTSNCTDTKTKEHLPGYQTRDFEVADYQMYPLDNTGLWFRGPEPKHLETDRYFVCIGAAQTFGCFCAQPFPKLLEAELDLPVLNLGYGGAGPYFFLKHPTLLDYINRARFVIVQVMSGRSESNSLFESGGLELLTRRTDGVQLGADAAYQALIEDSIWHKAPVGKRYFKRAGDILGQRKAKQIVVQTRQNWIHHHQELMAQITVPKILFWFSKRSPNYQERYSSVQKLFNDFPQLINSTILDEAKQSCDEYAECISKSGIPQPLFNRFTQKPTTIDPSLDRPDLGGKIWTHNTYYPSPEMHVEASQKLKKSCLKFV